MTPEPTPEPTPTPEPEPTTEPINNEPSPLEEADRINKEKAELLDREEKILDRKEKIIAAEAVGGRARVGRQEDPKDPKEKAKDYGKSIMAGKLPKKEDGK